MLGVQAAVDMHDQFQRDVIDAGITSGGTVYHLWQLAVIAPWQVTAGGADLFFAKGLSLDAELETHEKCILLGALKRTNGVQKRAAEILGINYRSLRHRLEKYGLLNSKNPALTDDSPAGQ